MNRVRLYRFWLICFAVALFPLAAVGAQDQLAAVEQLKTEAFNALRGGDFDKTNELLNQAADLSKDPLLVQMADDVTRAREILTR